MFPWSHHGKSTQKCMLTNKRTEDTKVYVNKQKDREKPHRIPPSTKKKQKTTTTTTTTKTHTAYGEQNVNGAGKRNA